MSENNEAGSFATAGSGKSEAEVAFDLLSKLKGQGVWGERNIGAILDMYAECLDAAKGLRTYEGQNRVDVPVQSPSANVTRPSVQNTPVQAPVTQAQAVQPQAPQAPIQPSQAQAVQTQPVHAQQQILQQAFKG